MDPVFLSRLQFAVVTMFHFLFVPLTLGLSIIIAYMETQYARTGNKEYLRMTKFWGKLFLINFAVGIVTGITLEFQFGTNWSRYSEYMGDIFGSLLAIEATAAFFLESTFIGIWVFGWKKLSAKAHAGVMWLVAISGNFSAIWILTANGFMQHPVGYTIRNNRTELSDFSELIFNKFSLIEIVHVIPSACLLGAFFVMGISAFHLLKKQHLEIFLPSFRIALVFGLVSSLAVAFTGDLHGVHVAEVQPAKLAAMEAHWETQAKAPIVMLAWPDEEAGKNLWEFGSIPGILSFLGFHDFNATVKGLSDFPKDERPPVLLTFLSFRIMVGLGTLFILLTLVGFIKRNRLMESPGYLKIMLWAIPLPYVAIETGWLVAEIGRQPWIVYGLMKTSQAVSPIAGYQVIISLVGFIVIYALLGSVGLFLLVKQAKKGPEPEIA